MDPAREKMTPVDRIRDLERRMKAVENDGKAPVPKVSDGDGRVKLNPPAGA